MKTKFTQILMLLAITVGVGVIVTSCKDTNEDDFNKLRSEIQDNNSLAAALKTQVNNLQAQIDELKNRLDRINECECDMNDLLRTIAGLQTDIANLKANKADKSEIDRLQGNLDALLANYNYLATLLNDNYVTKSVFESAIARLEKLIANAGGSETDISSILKRLADVENGLIEAKAIANAANDLAKNAKATADAAKEVATLAQTTALSAKSEASSAKSLAEAVQKIANSNTEKISTIETRLITMSVDVQTALTTAYAANQRSKNDSIRINALEKSLTALSNYFEKSQAEQDEKIKAQAESIKEQATSIKNLQKDVNSLRTETESKLAELKEYAEKQIADLNGRLDATNATVGELSDALTEVQSDVAELKTKVAELETLASKVDELSKKIDEYDGKLEKLSEVIAQQVSGVIVQGTYNPAFGTFGVPANIQSNVLVAYFGHAANKVKFPVLDGSTINYIRPEQVLTEAEANVIKGVEQFTAAADDYLVSNEEDNAGTLYLTINPAERNFEGLQLSLENSQAKKSGVKLGSVRKSDKTLGFGWTRAAGENGFYEVPAYVTAAGVKAVQKVNFNAEKTLNTLKDVYHAFDNRKTPSFTEFAQNIYDVLSGYNMDANAVKVAWTSADGEQHSVRSTYNIAATAVEPWNFGTLYGVEKEHVPGYNRAVKLIDRAANKAKSIIAKEFDKISAETEKTSEDLDKLKIDKIEISQVETGATSAEITVTIGSNEFVIDFEGDVKDEDGNLLGTITKNDDSVKITYDMSIEDLVDAANDTLEQLETLVNDANDLFELVNEIESDIDNAIDQEIANRAKSYLEKIDGKLVGLFNNINYRLQPVMLGGVNGTTLLSSAEAYPTKWKGNKIDLIPTTWSYELAAPVCKKHVAIVNVSKGGVNYASKAKAINNQNEKLNKVLDGNERFIRINGLEKGFTYTIAYSAMDYTGQIATHRSYVTVTE